jgi:hypothetical protein
VIYRKTIFVAAVITTSIWLTAPLLAQQPTLKSSGWGARMIMEPIIMAHGGFAATCNPRAAARAQWGVEQIEKAVSPIESQRAAFAELRAAAVKAVNSTVSACPREIPLTSGERLSFTKYRLEAILSALDAVAPAFAALYASLSDEQKARLDAGPRRWRWPR